GNPALANPVGGELWVSLAEKAYAQLNSQTNVLIRDTTGLNSYQAVEGGNAEPLKQITGLNYSYYSGEHENIGDSFSSGTHYSADPNAYKETIINLLKNGSIGWLGSDIDSTGANGKTELVSGHAFMLMGYDAVTDTFKIRNPWGGDGSSDYNPEFNLPLASFWNGTDIALTEPSLKNVDYVYTIETNANSKTNAVVEGDSVNFSISRADKGTADIVYYSITPISTNTDPKSPDYAVTTKSAVQFLSNTTTQNLSIPIFTDSLKEGVESFNIELYKSLDDTVPFVKSTNFIKDGVTDTNTYTITNTDSVIEEGGQAIFTIERSNSGTESTIYLNTLDETATSGDDYAGMDKQAVTFKANQTTATVNVDTYTDTLKEENETFKLDLYKYYSDTVPSAESNVSITDAVITQDYEYTITSDAASEESAKDEGSTITFTVKRNGTGTASTVYLKNEEGAAFAGVDYSDAFSKELQFAPDQDTLTFTVETFSDDQFEATEVFNLGLYKAQVSDEVAATVSSYIKNVSVTSYNYAITSDASDSESAVEEGNDITFTITRDGTGTESTIYVDTFDGTAVGTADDWSNDFEDISEQEITFAPDETTKTVTVKTYGDSNVEGVEDLNLGLYQYKSDAEYTDYSTAYIDDTIPDDYTYAISDETVYAGDQITFTITRDNQGSESTVYLWTVEDSANATNFEELAGTPLVFAPDETVKTVTVNTSTDTSTDSPVYKDFFLELYKYYNDENYASYGSATIANPLNEILGTAKIDTLLGTDAQDSIDGMAGNDKITGGLNQDVLTGGLGKDTFYYKSITDSLPNLPDIITDFSKGDKIDLKDIDANVDIAKDQAFTKPTVGAEFSGKFTKAGQLFFDTTHETLYGNIDKDGAADFAIQLNGVTNLVSGDLVL
ncbi:MAG: Calx-beta domain-containing protein, partial [Methylococcales bacterium]|nr:Calx-beta domain-containing protein [Methylococcales bacterium]